MKLCKNLPSSFGFLRVRPSCKGEPKERKRNIASKNSKLPKPQLPKPKLPKFSKQIFFKIKYQYFS